jgi:dTMP kinase
MAGRLIVFEGGEGCGKSTQLQALHQALRHSRLFQKLYPQVVPDILLTREPGGTALGGYLRKLLLHQETAFDLASRTELLLYAADRAQHVEECIKPALAAGCWVLCDRFVDSTVAYQGYGRGLNLPLIEQLNLMATGGLSADLTLWLKLDAAVGLARTRQRGQADRMEATDLAFHQRVQNGFAALAEQYPERIVAIDAAPAIETVAAEIYTTVEHRLQQWYETDLPD